MLWSDVGEDDARSNFGGSPLVCGMPEVSLAEIGEAEEPEDGIGDAGEDAEPRTESGRFDLESDR
jgi:hypothetical protein